MEEAVSWQVHGEQSPGESTNEAWDYSQEAQLHHFLALKTLPTEPQLFPKAPEASSPGTAGELKASHSDFSFLPSTCPTLHYATAQSQSICQETKANSSGLNHKLKEIFNRFTEHQKTI